MSSVTPLALTSANSPPTPRRLIATTKNPETAPPRRAGCRALFRSFVAPAAVLMLARIATHIPMYPAATEQSAPSANESVVQSASCEALAGSWTLLVRTNA